MYISVICSLRSYFPRFVFGCAGALFTSLSAFFLSGQFSIPDHEEFEFWCFVPTKTKIEISRPETHG